MLNDRIKCMACHGVICFPHEYLLTCLSDMSGQVSCHFYIVQDINLLHVLASSWIHNYIIINPAAGPSQICTDEQL